jgi:DNA helicase-2/ATP-dependent DNA helicase PcrA
VALKYENYLRKNKALDFVDLLLKTLEILRNNQSIRVEYQNKFSHILVDEFQDINEEVQ